MICIATFFLEEPHQVCSKHPKEHCDQVKVKVAKRLCGSSSGGTKKKNKGKKDKKGKGSSGGLGSISDLLDGGILDIL